MSGRIDTSHIMSPRDAMTAEEREAVRAELREASFSLWRTVEEHGSVRNELYALFCDATDESQIVTNAA